MALCKVNTGWREQKVCGLPWDWEIPMPQHATSVSLIPANTVQHGQERLVGLNRVARAVIDELRGIHDDPVFTYRGRPVTKMLNSA